MDRRSRWIAWAAAGAAGAVLLTGCVGDEEPAPTTGSPAPTLSAEELVDETQSTYQAFLDELYGMYADFDSDYTRLTAYATDEVATSAVADMEALHEQGLNIDSSPQVAVARLAEPDAAEIEVCIDSRGGRVYDVESGAVWEATASQINPWILGIEVTGDSVLIDSIVPSPDTTDVCASVS